MQRIFSELIARFCARGVLVDTNLMLLLVIGTYNPARIATFKRTLRYTYSDYILVADLVSRFRRRLTTPNILTEVDNLSRQTTEAEHVLVSQSLNRIMAEVVEVYFPSKSALGHPLHPKSGLADTTSILASEELLVVTDDLPLANRLASMGRGVININHLRL